MEQNTFDKLHGITYNVGNEEIKKLRQFSTGQKNWKIC